MEISTTNLDCLSGEYVEGLLADYLRDARSVSAEWQRYFAELVGDAGPRDARIAPSFRPESMFHASRARASEIGSPPASGNGQPKIRDENGQAAASHDLHVALLQDRVDQLIRSYRVRGHIVARIDPLDMPRPMPQELDPQFYGLTEADRQRPCSTKTISGPDAQTLGGVIDRLRNTYCRSIGVQFMHIDDESVRAWLQDRMEGTENRLDLSRGEQVRILTRLTDAVIFEEFVRKKYVGAKTFSLEGAESLIPLLDLAIERAARQGVAEIVIGMAHRGRLNVLVNIMGKRPREIFREFEVARPLPQQAGGDVKYHLGYSNDWKTADGRTVHLSLCFNPSHLEFVNPVVCGRMRAKQDRVSDSRRERGMALLIHGDAAFAGEGVVQETLNLSQLPGYRTGGTLHVVVNNQIGFTTGPEEGRSSTYATDVAKMLQSPIFHVNGEDPEAVAQVVSLALDFRKKFHRDVVIDMYCYRRWGHNEGDEPAFTQPILYQAIERRPSVRDAYLERLLQSGKVTREEAESIIQQRRALLEREFDLSKDELTASALIGYSSLAGVWREYTGGPDAEVPDIDTGLPREKLVWLLEKLTELPENFHLHRKLERFMEGRRAMARGEQPLDWAAAEALAFGSLAMEYHRVRLSGQDSARGTFGQRHAVFRDVQNNHKHTPLRHLTGDQAPVDVLNSPLSEAGVLGFDYGYSLDYPEGLVCWEAQFGDFWNAAQVIVDQFIASAEEKWRRLSGITLLLPHGFEGQGPEHSSARIERFLNLAARDNLQVVVPTTPAQYFHVLRRQVKRPWRKPLVVITPKGLLRHKQVVSSLEELSSDAVRQTSSLPVSKADSRQTGGLPHGNIRFQRVLPDHEVAAADVKRVVLCCGKVYYDLLARREELGRRDVAIVRLEQLYPFPSGLLIDALARYNLATPAYWVQEEPENMGAWPFMRIQFGDRLLGRFPLTGIARPASASPATGSSVRHQQQQDAILAKAFG